MIPKPMIPKPAAPKTVFSERSESRKNNFDALRFLLAALVIFSHTHPPDGILGVIGTDQSTIALHGLAVKFLGPGRMAVNFFFVISGFLIASSWIHSRGTVDYLRKRLLRIYPGFATALLFCVFVVGPLAGVPLAAYFHNPQTYRFIVEPLLLKGLPGLPGVFAGIPGAQAVDVPLWTIRYELFCYLLVVVLGALGLIAYGKRSVVLGLFLVTWSLFNAQCFRLPTVWDIHCPYFGSLNDLPRLFTFFLAGVTFYLYRDVIPCSRPLFALSVLILALTYKLGISFTLPVCGSYALFYLAFSRSLQWHNFARYGDMSYGMYLYAFPIQQLLVQFLGYDLGLGYVMNRTVHFLLAMAITFPLACLSWHCVEKRFIQRKPKPSAEARPVRTAAASEVVLP